MRRTLLSFLFCGTLTAAAFAQSPSPTPTATATASPSATTATEKAVKARRVKATSRGEVATYERGRTISIRENGNPVSYALGRTVHFVDKAGRKINEDVIQPGKRVIVTYTGIGEKRRVKRVQVEN